MLAYKWLKFLDPLSNFKFSLKNHMKNIQYLESGPIVWQSLFNDI